MAREQAKLTQEQFAERIDVSPQYVSDLERGVVGVSIATLKRICTVLGVSSDQILFGKQTENRAVFIADKCKSLSEHQYLLLSDIISKYVEAISNFPLTLSIRLVSFQNWTGILSSFLVKLTGNFQISVLLSNLAPFLFVPFGRKSIE